MAEMTPERIAEIRQRERQASEGPWYIEPHDRPGFSYERRIYDRRCWGVCKPTSGKDGQDEANVQFIIHARQDIPDLLDALARAQQEIADRRRQAQAWAQYAFTHHGNDAVLYNGLADLGGVTPDGEGWLAPRPPQETGGSE